MDESTSTFELDLPAAGGKSRVVVNGTDVADQVHGLILEAGTGKPARLTLFGPAGGTVVGEGIVQVAADPDDDGVVAFLSAIAPDELERVALNRDDIEANGGLTATMLRQLIDWASGA